jgi:hypothetical protein
LNFLVAVAQWESGICKPAGVVCRLLDKISDNPAEYLASLIHRKSRIAPSRLE